MPRGKNSKESTQYELHEGDRDDQTSPASNALEDNNMLTDAGRIS